jgi:hypothetical protein
MHPLCVWCSRMVIWYAVENLRVSGSIETIYYGIQYVESVGKFYVILVHMQNHVEMYRFRRFIPRLGSATRLSLIVWKLTSASKHSSNLQAPTVL